MQEHGIAGVSARQYFWHRIDTASSKLRCMGNKAGVRRTHEPMPSPLAAWGCCCRPDALPDALPLEVCDRGWALNLQTSKLDISTGYLLLEWQILARTSRCL